MSDAQATLEKIRAYHADLTQIRRDLHANPELGLETHRTADIVAEKLASWGIEVHKGIGQTGVVGVLRAGNGNRAIGLRADMDALPITEETGAAYASRTPGVMHACGHDGHTTTLLGAARYLAETRNFNGTVHFIFQPGEEGAGGALAMLEDGLFDRFACDQIYAYHNRPGAPLGQFAITPGEAMAGGAFFDITISGRGAHGARPQAAIDPVLAACQIGTALQSVVSRNIADRHGDPQHHPHPGGRGLQRHPRDGPHGRNGAHDEPPHDGGPRGGDAPGLRRRRHWHGGQGRRRLPADFRPARQ